MDFMAFRGMKPFSQFIFSLFVMLVSVFIFFLLAILLAIPFFGLGVLIDGMTATGMMTPEGMVFIKYFTVVQFIGLFIVPSLILAWLYHGNIREYLKVDRSTNLQAYLYSALAVLMLIPLINFVGEINNQMNLPESLAGLEDWMRSMEDSTKVLTEKFLRVETIPAMLFNIFMMAILPALGEELMFRGVIQRIFTNWTKNYHWGIWIAAIIFSGFHMQFYGFLPRMLLGAMFGYMLVWTGTMWIPILAHFVNNTMVIVSYYLIEKGTISNDVEQWGTGQEQYPLVLFSLVSAGILLFLVYRSASQPKMPANQIDSQAPRID